MNAIWVLENCKKSDDFYTKQLVLMLLASVALWKRYHPLHDVFLYLDTVTYNKFKNTPIFSFFPTTIVFEYDEKIDRSIFWSSSKTKIISEIKDPTIVVDHDFLIFKNISNYLKDNVLFTHDEIASNWYPKTTDKFVRQIDYKFEIIDDTAANVSLFYLPDPEFSNKYGKQVIKNHEQFSNFNSKECSTNHMILSEQLMLKQWLLKDNIKYKILSKNIFDCKKLEFTNNINNKGIWNLKESSLYYKHYGVKERDLINDKPTHQFLLRCINAGGIINSKELDENRFWG